MSIRLRYYKNDDCKFHIMCIMNIQTQRYLTINNNGRYDTLKDVIKSISDDVPLMEYLKRLDEKEKRVMITMHRNSNNNYHDSDDKDNILHYCDEAVFYFIPKDLRLEKAYFTFSNMEEETEFQHAEYFSEDGSVRIGSGALDAMEYFTDECKNRYLADYLISKHFEFDVKY